MNTNPVYAYVLVGVLIVAVRGHCLGSGSAEAQMRPEVRWADLSEDEAQALDWLASTDEDLHPDRSLASRDLVERLLGGLKPKDRLVITLMNLEGRSIEEVNQRTGWSHAVIKVRAFRARAKLRKLLGQLMKEKMP